MKSHESRAQKAPPVQMATSGAMPTKEPPALQLQASRDASAPLQKAQGKSNNVVIPAGAQFESFMANLAPLEQAAMDAGMGFNARISAFRKLYYRGFQAGPVEMWDAIIPRAINNDMPASWEQGELRQRAQHLRDNKEIAISGRQVDMGHVFAGLDARQHRSPITIGVASMSDNMEAATWVGDLSAVAGEFYRDFRANGGKEDYSNVDLVDGTFVENETDALTRRYFNDQFKPADLHSDMDSFAINLNPSQTIHSNLYNYYHIARDGQGQSRRYTRFAQNSGVWDSRLQPIPDQVRRIKEALIQATIMYQSAEYRRDTGFSSDSADWGAADDRDIFGNPKYFKEHHLVNNIVDILVEYFVRRINLGIQQEHD